MKKKATQPLSTLAEESDTVSIDDITPVSSEKQVTKNLKCILLPAELVTMGQELARAHAACDEVEERKKDIDAQLKAEIESHATRGLSLARTINNGYVYRDVPCTLRFDYVSNTVTTIRLDTLIVVDTRAMTVEERQTSLL